MKNENSGYFTKYIKLVDEIDRRSAILEDMHKNQMKCSNGCDLCCIDFGILPIEYHYILNKIKKEDQLPDLPVQSADGTCSFLKNHSCSIYKHRPIMCRTHGLPLLYANDYGEWELSVCELNFTEFDFQDFTTENTFLQDKYNSKLFMLNREFISKPEGRKYDEMELIPMNKLAKQLKNNK